MYDIAIIGTGPAGLEAAITAKIRKKNILLLGSKHASMKVEKAHAIQNYLGLPNIKGEDLVKAFMNHLKELDIEITEDNAMSIYNMGDYFAIQGKNNDMYEASSVILATGVVASKPYPKEEELLGRGVSYCATCDAALYKGKTTAVIGFSPDEELEAEFLAEYAGTVYYFPMYQEEVKNTKGLTVIKEKPVSIEGTMKVEKLVTDKNEYAVDGIFILREAIAPSQLVPGLETDGPHVKVDLSMATSMKGVFACGDIAGLPYQYIKSAGQGNVAALSAVNYLATKNRK